MINGLSERLKKLRWDSNISQRDVAKRLGISTSIVSGYETGERTPSAENLLALSYLYKCSTDYLLGKERKVPGITLDADGLTPRQVELLAELIASMRA